MQLTIPSIGWAAFCAAAFVLWPTVGKMSGASGAWINVLILFWSTVAGVLFSRPAIMAQGWPSMKAVLIMALAGLINGAAVYYYSMQTSHPNVPIGRFIAVTTMLMVVLGPIFAMTINGEAIALRQILGIVLATAAIYLIAG